MPYFYDYQLLYNNLLSKLLNYTLLKMFLYGNPMIKNYALCFIT